MQREVFQQVFLHYAHDKRGVLCLLLLRIDFILKWTQSVGPLIRHMYLQHKKISQVKTRFTCNVTKKKECT